MFTTVIKIRINLRFRKANQSHQRNIKNKDIFALAEAKKQSFLLPKPIINNERNFRNKQF